MNKLKVGEKSVTSSWCLFRSSSAVRDAIKFRMRDMNLNGKQLAEISGVQASRISLYLNNKQPSVNQFQLYTICEKLGIEAKVEVKLKLL